MKLNKILVTLSILIILMTPVITTQGQTIIFSDDFESGDFSAWDGGASGTGDTRTVTEASKYDGSYGARFTTSGDPGTESSYCYITTSSLTEVYARGYVYVSESGIVENEDRFSFIRFDNVAYGGWRRIGNVVNWALIIRNSGGSVVQHSTATPQTDTWYFVELHWVMDAVNGYGELYVDGELVCEITEMDTDDFGGIVQVRFGLGEVVNCGPTEVYGDEFVVSDSYIGEKTYILLYGVDGQGTFEASPNGPYTRGTDVTLTATASPGWEFAEWSGDISGSENPKTITINDDTTVIAKFTSTGDITVTTSKTTYNRLETLVIRVRGGTLSGTTMLQVNRGSTLVWMDQRDLDSSGNLDYNIKIPNTIPLTWTDGTYTVYVKDVDTSTYDSVNFAIPVPAPLPPSGGGGVVGGGGGLVLPNPSYIATLSPENAAALLDDFGSTDIAAVLSSVANNDHVANILEAFNPDLATEILEKMTQQKKLGYLRLMSDESVMNLIIGFDETNKNLLQSLVDDDFERAARLIEEAIKIKVEGLSNEARKEALEKLGEAVSSLDKQSLVDLMVYIAKLPETPTTVAYMFESMSFSTVLDIVNVWLGEPQYSYALSDLANVFEHLTTETLGRIYRGITDQGRVTLLGYLSDQVTASLPVIGVFEVTDLKVTPSEIEPGVMFQITYTLKNAGNKTDDYVVAVKLNDETVFTDEGILETGESVTLEHTMTKYVTGTYTVDILGETLEFEIKETVIPEPEKPADFVVTSIEIVPNRVTRGEEISIFVVVENMGDLTGTKSVDLYIDSAVADTKQATLLGGEDIMLNFVILAEYGEGSHTVRAGAATSSFQVLIEEAPLPWLTIITVLIVIAVVAFYVIRMRTQGQ